MKPEVDRKGEKGRRHAGEQLLKKRLAGQGYLLKTVVAAKPLGKRRRARLLSEAGAAADGGLADEIPYSLNRKNRWELESAAELLQEDDGAEHRRDPAHAQVAFSAVDARFGAYGGFDKHVMAQHQLLEDGAVGSRTARSQRGSRLHDTGSNKALEVRYVMSKVHPATKLASGNTFKSNKPLARSTRRAQLELSVYSTDGELGPAAEEANNTANQSAMTRSQLQQSEEVMNLYRPKQHTYTLADFVQDKSAPVMVGRPRPESVTAAEDAFEQVSRSMHCLYLPILSLRSYA